MIDEYDKAFLLPGKGIFISGTGRDTD